YLVSVLDPYDSISPHHTWGPVAFTGTALAKRLKMQGRVMDVQTELNASGRVKTLTVVGSQGTLESPGANVRQRLGVRDAWCNVGVLSLSAPATTVVYGSRAH